MQIKSYPIFLLYATSVLINSLINMNATLLSNCYFWNLDFVSGVWFSVQIKILCWYYFMSEIEILETHNFDFSNKLWGKINANTKN